MESQRDKITIFLNIEILDWLTDYATVENETFNLEGSPGTSMRLTFLSGEEERKSCLRKLLWLLSRTCWPEVTPSWQWQLLDIVTNTERILPGRLSGGHSALQTSPGLGLSESSYLSILAFSEIGIIIKLCSLNSNLSLLKNFFSLEYMRTRFHKFQPLSLSLRIWR